IVVDVDTGWVEVEPQARHPPAVPLPPGQITLPTLDHRRCRDESHPPHRRLLPEEFHEHALQAAQVRLGEGGPRWSDTQYLLGDSVQALVDRFEGLRRLLGELACERVGGHDLDPRVESSRLICVNRPSWPITCISASRRASSGFSAAIAVAIACI